MAQQLRESSDEWELVAASEVHVVGALKQEGNMLFQQRRFFDAIQTYGRALAHIQPIDVSRLSLEDGKSLEQLETAVRLNRALAYIELQDANLLAYAEEDCSIVLDRQPQCVKAFYRRALARERLGKIKYALLDAEKMCALEPANPAAHQLLARLQEAWSSERVQPLPVERELSVGLMKQCSLTTASPSRTTREDTGNRTSALDAWTALQAEEQLLRDEVFKQSAHKSSACKGKATAASNEKVGARRKQADLGARVVSDGANVRTKTESLWVALMEEETSTVERICKTRAGAASDNIALGELNPPSAASIHPRR